MPVHAREMELVLEIGDGAKLAQDHAGADILDEIGEQRREPAHFDVRNAGERDARERDALVDSDARTLARRIGDRDDQAIEQRRRARGEIDVTVRDRIERAGIDRHSRTLLRSRHSKDAQTFPAPRDAALLYWIGRRTTIQRVANGAGLALAVQHP